MATNANDLRPICANCCSISSLYTEYPGCIGGAGKYSLLCFDTEYKCLKFPNSGDGKDILCVCQETSCNIIMPKTCIQGTNQCFCLDSRCALPCTDDVPCLVTLCFLTCFSKWNFKCGFFKTIGEL